MLGLGEEWNEVVDTLADLRRAGCGILTLGQYLRPSAAHLPMTRYYHPDEFRQLKEIALEMGFAHVESGPLVRSSYHAHEQADAFRTATRGPARLRARARFPRECHSVLSTSRLSPARNVRVCASTVRRSRAIRERPSGMTRTGANRFRVLVIQMRAY